MIPLYQQRDESSVALEVGPDDKAWLHVGKAWPDENGMTPRDTSFGYLDYHGARVSLFCGDMIVMTRDFKHVIGVLGREEFRTLYRDTDLAMYGTVDQRFYVEDHSTMTR
jgi:hypothetical protein